VCPNHAITHLKAPSGSCILSATEEGAPCNLALLYFVTLILQAGTPLAAGTLHSASRNTICGKWCGWVTWIPNKP